MAAKGGVYARCGVDALNLASLLGELKCAAERGTSQRSIAMTMSSVDADLEALDHCKFAGSKSGELHRAAKKLRSAASKSSSTSLVAAAEDVLNVLYKITQPERPIY